MAGHRRANGQVRAIAYLKLQKLGNKLKAEPATNEEELAQHTLLAADIKRFMERSAETEKVTSAPSSPPGAPIGDTGMDWLAPAPGCNWSDAHPDSWSSNLPPM